MCWCVSVVNINIEIPDKLHKELKLHAVASNTTLKALINDALKTQAKPSRGKT